MDTFSLRMLDANANRAREALRVMEDYARFVLNDEKIAGEVKEVRHLVAHVVGMLPDAILARDTEGDVGREIKTATEMKRADLGAVVVAAGKRLSEALRVIEEIVKTSVVHYAAETIEKARYRGYVIEQILVRAANQQGRFSDVRLYILLTEKLCKLPWEQTLEVILKEADLGFGAPAIAIQLREKELSDTELLRRARIVVGMCREHGATAIINDRPDVAILAGADGVHLGQGDLPANEARRIFPSHLVIGVSTENIEQARQAVRDGATYVGVGPMFHTTTKEKPRIAGPAYAKEAVANLPVPCVAIGGITAKNVGELKAVGVKSVAVCSAIISDAAPETRTREFLELIQ